MTEYSIKQPLTRISHQRSSRGRRSAAVAGRTDGKTLKAWLPPCRSGLQEYAPPRRVMRRPQQKVGEICGLRLRSIHPGEILREVVLPALGLFFRETARRLGVSRQQVHSALACAYPVTAEMALRVGKLVGKDPRLWLSLQQNYGQWRAQQGLRGELEKIKPIVTSPADLPHH